VCAVHLLVEDSHRNGRLARQHQARREQRQYAQAAQSDVEHLAGPQDQAAAPALARDTVVEPAPLLVVTGVVHVLHQLP